MRQRPDSEAEQALIRLAIVSIVFLYFLASAGRDGRIGLIEAEILVFLGAYIFFSLTIIASIARSPRKPNPGRRIVGMIGDIGGTCYIMLTRGEAGAPVYVILLWVAFGNGFRFGRKYLLMATVLAFVGFLSVILTSEYWHANRVLSVGLLVGIAALPAYISSLLKKLTNAVRRAEEANLAKDKFLANMSHEMRTPLTGIVGMLDLLADTSLTAEQQEFADTIRASALTLLSLIEDVLDISKIEAGKLTLERVDFDLHALLRSTAAMLGPQAHAKGLRLTTQVRSEIPFLLRGDPLLIRQVLLNLLANAVKFTDKGAVALRLSQTAETESAVTLRFEVADTGIGIPPEAQARIFDRFTQADDSITRRYGGTGLGTTIAKQLVELMGGQIGVQSEAGTGSVFWFTLELGKQAVPDSEAGTATGLRGRRILVVSADGKAAQTLEEFLESWGMVTAVATRAAEAFAPLVSAAGAGKPFDLAIIVEQGLDMDPGELAKAIKSVQMIQQVQLVLAARDGAEPDLDRAAKDGFGAAVRSPVHKTMLFNALHLAQPAEPEGSGVASLAGRYRQRLSERMRLRVLVAEDNAINQKVIAKILERAGHTAHLVGNGEEALDLLEKDGFDLVLMDLQMPVMGGLEAAKVYRLLRSEDDRIPIVALTADATDESRKACREAGFDGYLTKPVEPKQLLEIVGTVVPSKVHGTEGAPKESASSPLPFPQEAGGPSAEKPVIDRKILEELRALGGGDAFLEKVVGIFIEGGEQKLQEIERAATARTYGRVREIAHTLKGSAGQIGAVRLMELCHALSRSGPSDLEGGGEAHVARLREEFERARRALRQHVRKPGAAAS